MPTPELVSLVARTITGEQHLLAALDAVAEISLSQLALLRAGKWDAYCGQFAPKREAIEAAKHIDRGLAPLREQCRQAHGLPVAARHELARLAEQQLLLFNRISDSERELAHLQLARFPEPSLAGKEALIA